MDYSFPHYLLAKQSVDDRALNRTVYTRLAESLGSDPLRMIEVGAGIGTMLTRLLRWGLFTRADYVLVDEMAENIKYAAEWLPTWAGQNGLQVDLLGPNQLRLYDASRDVLVSLVQADVFDFINSQPQPADVLIAHAFLDLLNMPESLRELFTLLKPDGLAWLTINFDGVTTFEPVVQPDLDREIERLYHQTMDTRPTGGDSQAGRHLFSHLRGLGAQILASGASDWVVHAIQDQYPADEAYFLNFILHFFELSLAGHKELNGESFSAWLTERRAQIESAELVYIAHQIDFLVKPAGV
ncbi:MAG: class I SAM-dependent methyltransferase [Chloroflexi bacterium]|nr:class I SAM-dependent methyltransferase [Chloroflexota bacterium]